MNDLEAEDPPVADPPAADPPAADPPEPEPDPDPQGTVVVNGQKMIPVGAVIEERRQRQAIKADLDRLAHHVHQAQPYIDFLAANPDLMSGTRATRSDAVQPKAEEIDPRAIGLATTLDLYGADGKPDAIRGQKIIDMIDGISDEKADAKVKPIQESTQRERANHMYARALVTKAPDGSSVDREVLDALWTRTPASVLATEEGAAGVVAMAMGLTTMKGGRKVAAPALPAPLHTESPGSRNPRQQAVSPLGQRIANIRGMDEKTYADRSKGFNPGRTNVLED